MRYYELLFTVGLEYLCETILLIHAIHMLLICTVYLSGTFTSFTVYLSSLYLYWKGFTMYMAVFNNSKYLLVLRQTTMIVSALIFCIFLSFKVLIVVYTF